MGFPGSSIIGKAADLQTKLMTGGQVSGFDELTGKILPGTPTAGKEALKKAMRDAIKARLDMFHKGLEMTAPYRESGERALSNIVRNASEGGPLYGMQKTAGTGAISATLAKMGYSPEEITRALGRFGEQLDAREFDQRTGRMSDVVNLGQGFAARGAGAAGSTGTGMASSIIRGGAGIADAYGYKAAASQVPLAAATYGIDRAVGDIYLNKIINSRQQQQSAYTGPLSPGYSYG